MDDSGQSLLSHLLELRTRLLRVIVALLLVFVFLTPFAGELYALLSAPLYAVLPAGAQMIATDVTTPFFVPIKMAALTALLLILPYALYQMWAFVAPGLYSHEKKLIAPLVVASSVLFALGMAFAYFIVFPVVFTFIIAAAPQGVAVMTDISKYLDFALTMFLAFGISFQVPVVVVVVVRSGIVEINRLREWRPYVIVGAFVLGAIFTPPDVVSQLLLAIPLWLLFEAGLAVAAWFVKPLPKPDTLGAGGGAGGGEN
ncbi:MAG: twin-arginine translocase subunit TatC [Burkholderiales bacterium]